MDQRGSGIGPEQLIEEQNVRKESSQPITLIEACRADIDAIAL
jgi:hypothetical protein